MIGRITLEIDSFILRKIEGRARNVFLTPDKLISTYLNYCLLHHDKIIEFERKVQNRTTLSLEPINKT